MNRSFCINSCSNQNLVWTRINAETSVQAQGNNNLFKIQTWKLFVMSKCAGPKNKSKSSNFVFFYVFYFTFENFLLSCRGALALHGCGSGKDEVDNTNESTTSNKQNIKKSIWHTIFIYFTSQEFHFACIFPTFGFISSCCICFWQILHQENGRIQNMILKMRTLSKNEK